MVEAKPSLIATIRELFSSNGELTVKQLYELLGEQMTKSGDEKKFKHRVRATIFTLYRNNELVHVEKAKWKKA